MILPPVLALSHQSSASLPAPPVNTRAPSVTPNPQVGDTAYADPGDWSGRVDAFTYQWVDENGDDIAGQTTDSFAIVAPDGKYACRVTAHNAGGATSLTSGETWKIPPVNTVAPALSSTGSIDDPRVGDTLFVDNGTWLGETVNFTYQWYGGSGPIEGATDSDTNIYENDVSSQLYCQVTAYNSEGNASNQNTPAVSNLTGMVSY